MENNSTPTPRSVKDQKTAREGEGADADADAEAERGGEEIVVAVVSDLDAVVELENSYNVRSATHRPSRGPNALSLNFEALPFHVALWQGQPP